MKKLENILNIPADSVIDYFIEVDVRYLDIIKQKTKNFPIAPENKIIHKDKNNEYMKKLEPKNFTKAKKLLRNWNDKKLFDSL